MKKEGGEISTVIKEIESHITILQIKRRKIKKTIKRC